MSHAYTSSINMIHQTFFKINHSTRTAKHTQNTENNSIALINCNASFNRLLDIDYLKIYLNILVITTNKI